MEPLIRNLVNRSTNCRIFSKKALSGLPSLCFFFNISNSEFPTTVSGFSLVYAMSVNDFLPLCSSRHKKYGRGWWILLADDLVMFNAETRSDTYSNIGYKTR